MTFRPTNYRNNQLHVVFLNSLHPKTSHGHAFRGLLIGYIINEACSYDIHLEIRLFLYRSFSNRRWPNSRVSLPCTCPCLWPPSLYPSWAAAPWKTRRSRCAFHSATSRSTSPRRRERAGVTWNSRWPVPRARWP